METDSVNENPLRGARLDPDEMIDRWSAGKIDVDFFADAYISASNAVQNLKDLLELSNQLDTMPHLEIDNVIDEMIKKVENRKILFLYKIDKTCHLLVKKLNNYAEKCRQNVANLISTEQIFMFKRVQAMLKEWRQVLNDSNARRENWRRIRKESKVNIKILYAEIKSINANAALNQLIFYQLMCLGFSKKKIPQQAINISMKLLDNNK